MMKWMFPICACMMVVFINGCARSLPPHEELNQAVKKSFDSNGFNYSSKSRITDLSVPKPEAKSAADDKGFTSAGALLDIVRGFSVNVDGALDMKGKKSEALYDLRYNRDNLDVSIKLPILFDYGSSTIYVGPSLLNTILDIASPAEAETRGKLIRIHIPELLREQALRSPELSKLVDEERFSQKNMDAINNVFKAAVIKAVARLNDANFSDQPLTEEDRRTGIERRIRITLGHNDAITVVVGLIDSISQTLYQEGAISKKEYAVLLTLSDRQKIDQFMKQFEMAMTQDVGLEKSGYVGSVVSRLSIADGQGKFRVGLENVSEFNRYNAPYFSIHPQAGQYVDFKQVLDSLDALKTKEQKSPQPAAETPAGNVAERPSPQP